MITLAGLSRNITQFAGNELDEEDSVSDSPVAVPLQIRPAYTDEVDLMEQIRAAAEEKDLTEEDLKLVLSYRYESEDLEDLTLSDAVKFLDGLKSATQDRLADFVRKLREQSQVA